MLKFTIKFIVVGKNVQNVQMYMYENKNTKTFISTLLKK